jgi:hypothetical protein
MAAQSASQRVAEEIELLVRYSGRLMGWIEAAKKQQPSMTLPQAIEPIAKSSKVSRRELFKIFNALENLNNLKQELGTSEKIVSRLQNSRAKSR